MSDGRIEEAGLVVVTVIRDLERDVKARPPLHANFHESYDRVLERVEALWRVIKDGDRDEAIAAAHQVAMMAIRLIVDARARPPSRLRSGDRNR